MAKFNIRRKKEIDAVVEALQIIISGDKEEEEYNEDIVYDAEFLETKSNKKSLKKHRDIFEFLKLQ